jgi:uncharacterized membrane protein YphA (DoxX/SURF4 family)
MSGLTPTFPAPTPESSRWRRPRWRSVLHGFCRYLLAAIFLMAAVTKITDLNDFTNRMLLHGRLPHTLAVTVAAVLPWLELTCGLCLAFGCAVREAACLLSILLILFLLQGLFQPADADCGCFLFPRALQLADNGAWFFMRNLFLLACGLLVAWTPRPMDQDR